MSDYIYDSNIDKLTATVERLNKRADRLGVPPMVLTMGERERVYACPEGGPPNLSTDPNSWGGEPVISHERAEVTLSGQPPRLAGWTFAAVVDHLSNGIVTRYPYAENEIDLKPFRGADATCDHCNTKRQRHETFIVEHFDGQIMRVGRNCIADFLGGVDPAQLIGHLNLWGKALNEFDDMVEAGMGSGTNTLGLAVFLGHVAQQMRIHGWVSRGKVYDQGFGVATADVAQSAYWSKVSRDNPDPTHEDMVRASKALGWVRSLSDSDVDENDYLFNLRAVCTDDHIRPKRGGLAGSVIVAAEMAAERAAEREAEADKSNEHVGEIKERLTLQLTLKGTREFEGQFGVTVLHKFEDAAGNSLVWFGSNPNIIPEGTSKRPMEIGETMLLSGTVKKHDDFKGRKQTGLSRVSVPKRGKK